MNAVAPSPAGQTTRERLMRAAVSIVAHEGLAAATTAAIASEAGVAEGTLYRHFESKDDMLIAAYRQIKTEMFVNVVDAVDTTVPPPERLKLGWKAIYLAYRSDRDAFTYGQRFAESALAEREGGDAARAIGKLIADLRHAGIASGDFRNLPVDLLANIFLASISYLLKSEIKGRKWTDAELDHAASAAVAGWLK
jgi:AcrR family transcriptional regulator